jgi:hypothetical protein
VSTRWRVASRLGATRANSGASFVLLRKGRCARGRFHFKRIEGASEQTVIAERRRQVGHALVTESAVRPGESRRPPCWAVESRELVR